MTSPVAASASSFGNTVALGSAATDQNIAQKQMFVVNPRLTDTLRLVTAAPAGATPRYAIYYAPPRNSVWWMFGSAWLGRDAVTDGAATPPALGVFDAATIAHITRSPRRYGFHATLKPPFRLTPDYGAQDVCAQAANLARSLEPVPLPQLQLTEIDDFVALSFDANAAGAAACHAIAAKCVSCFDNLRARPDAEELARRHAAGLSPRQAQLLAAWGYPYVFDTFRFHLTLTERLTQHERRRVIDALAPLVARMQSQQLVLDALCVYQQPQRDAPFVVTRRYNFDGSVEIYRDD